MDGIEIGSVGCDEVLDVEHQVSEGRALLIGEAVGCYPSADAELLHISGGLLVDHGVEHGYTVDAYESVIVEGMVFVDLGVVEILIALFELLDLIYAVEGVLSA